jgi:demethylmenaquinone methyltransferase/2-methoxy-6-polyprenyl-1,4-benzoquinol methylase
MPFDHFNLIAGLFERTAKYTPAALLLDLLDLHPGEYLLDAGGGTGRVAQALREMVQVVVIVDPSRGMLRYAMGKGVASCCAPAERIPLASNSINRIIMVDAFHHLYHQEDVVSEFWRVLTLDGIIVIIEPDIQKWVVKLIALGEKMMLMRSHFFSAGKIAALLEKPGINVRVVYSEMQYFVCAKRVREM